jgi:hypothetical protein
MKTLSIALIAAAAIGALAPAVAAGDAPTSAPTTWGFDSDEAGAAPGGFAFARTGEGREGRWTVLAQPDAPSAGHVLAQVDDDRTGFRFPVAVVEGQDHRDLQLSVRCKLVSGEVDQACGLVFRYRDANNYCVTRANALEGNIRLYTVKDGRRRQIASFSGSVTPGTWHDYRVEATGAHIEVFWDGQKVLSADDATFGEGGTIGMWTKADSVTYFDDLSVTPR